MPYSVARLPAPIDKAKNLPGVDTSEITTRRRILTVGSFVSTVNVLNTQKSVQQASQATRSSNQGNIVQLSGVTQALLSNVAPSVPYSPTKLVTSFTNITSTNCDCTVSWSVPNYDGRSPITSYSITGSPDNLSATTNGLTRTFTFTGLSIDTLYTFSVTATNIIGTSDPATVTATTPIAPSSPTGLATSIDTNFTTYMNCTVSWNIPSSNGGAAITGYSITGSPDNLSATTNASTRTFTFTGLSGGTLYTFTVAATNIRGNSVPATVTVTTPGASDNTSYANDTSTYNKVTTTQTSVTASKTWATEITGTTQTIGSTITKDSNKNVIVVGYFTGTITAYDKTGTAFGTTLSNSGGYDTFIVQYSSTGSVNWVAKLGGTSTDQPMAVRSDSSGNIIVVGYFSSSTLTAYDKDGTAFGTTLSDSGGSDAFIVQYSSTGSVNWIAKIGGTAFDYGFAVTLDSSGNIIIDGHFYSSTLTAYDKDGTAFGTTLTKNNSDEYLTFTANYNSTGYVTNLNIRT